MAYRLVHMTTTLLIGSEQCKARGIAITFIYQEQELF